MSLFALSPAISWILESAVVSRHDRIFEFVRSPKPLIKIILLCDPFGVPVAKDKVLAVGPVVVTGIGIIFIFSRRVRARIILVVLVVDNHQVRRTTPLIDEVILRKSCIRELVDVSRNNRLGLSDIRTRAAAGPPGIG